MSTATEAAQRIVALAERPIKARPSIEELERILQQPDGPPITINPDGSIGAGTNDALTIAHAYISACSALEKIEGGHFDNASTLVVNGDWRACYEALQGIARGALNE